MLRLPVDILQPGMTLAKPIQDEQGNVLLRGGVLLTDDYIENLQRRSVLSVYIQDGDTDDIDVDDVISDEVRRKTQDTLNRIFSFVEDISAELADDEDDNVDALVREIKKPQMADALRDHKGFKELGGSVTSILDEIMDSETMTNISQIRSQNGTMYTHAINVTVAALMIGKRLHLNEGDLKRLGAGCMLHDIGKIFLHAQLEKSQRGEPLSPKQQQLLFEHPRLGYELLRTRNPDAVMANHVALEHHERQDGLGYPRGLHGTNSIDRPHNDKQNVLLIAEIAAVADVYDTLSINKPGYRALTPKQTADTLRRLAGTFLNQEIVQLFLSMLPVLPPGISLIVRTGRYVGYKGVVLRSDEENPDRPMIRLIYNQHGDRIMPIEISLARDESITVEATLNI